MPWPASARNDRAAAWLRATVAACLAGPERLRDAGGSPVSR